MSPLLTFSLLAVYAAALILALRMVRPRGQQPRHGAAWLDAHGVPAEDRHYVPVRALPAAPAEPSALATTPDPTFVRAA